MYVETGRNMSERGTQAAKLPSWLLWVWWKDGNLSISAFPSALRQVYCLWVPWGFLFC